MNTPNSDALRFAAEWLRQYEDTHDGDGDAVVAEAVAKWLDTQADAQDERTAAREFGVSTAQLRAAIAKATGA